MNSRSKRTQILHVGDDTPLRASRSAILSIAFQVIDCTSRNALTTLLVRPEVEAVVFCGSITPDVQESLIERMHARCPSLQIFQMSDLDWRSSHNTYLLDPHAPQCLVESISSALTARQQTAGSSHNPAARASIT